MFCSKQCADSLVHRFECNALNEENFEKLLLQRMLFQAIEIAGSLEDLQELMTQQDPTKTIMDYDLSEPNDPMALKKWVLATTSLAEREPLSAEAFEQYESIIQQLKPKNEDQRKFVRNYLERCLKSMTVNFFHFFWSPTQARGQGYALCSLAAYFAHSCEPNVDKIDADNKFMFVAKKPIKAGDQLFMNYDRYSFLTHCLEERQKYFLEMYDFNCGCVACVNDFPMLSKMKKFDVKDTEMTFDSLESAKQLYEENCDFIRENIEKYPCFEVCSMMQQNYFLLHTISNKLPF